MTTDIYDEHDIPRAARFAVDEEGILHTISMFGDAACTDMEVEGEDGDIDYQSAPRILDYAPTPEIGDPSICELCLRAWEAGE